MKVFALLAFLFVLLFSVRGYACYKDLPGLCGANESCDKLCEPGSNCTHDDGWVQLAVMESVGNQPKGTTGQTENATRTDCRKAYHCIKKVPQTSCPGNSYQCANGQTFATSTALLYTATGGTCP